MRVFCVCSKCRREGSAFASIYNQAQYFDQGRRWGRIGGQLAMDSDGGVDYDELENALGRAQTQLNKLQYSDAESTYRYVLRRLESFPRPPSPPSVDAHRPATLTSHLPLTIHELTRQKVDRVTVTAVSGLGETLARQSRSLSVVPDSRDDGGESVDGPFTSWVRMMVQALSLHREAVELSRGAQQRHQGRLSESDLDYFKDLESQSLNRARMIEESLVATIKDQILVRNGIQKSHQYYKSQRSSNRSRNESASSRRAGRSWLENVLTRCSESSTGTDVEETPPDTAESMSSSSSSLSLQGTELQQTQQQQQQQSQQQSSTEYRCRRRINFEHIQSAIRQMVSEASAEVRAQYGHLVASGAVTQSLLQRRVASELMVRLGRNGQSAEDMEAALMNAITFEEEWQQQQNRLNRSQNLDTAVSPDNPLSQTTSVDEESNDDDSDSNCDDNYETVTVDCPATTAVAKERDVPGHVILIPSHNQTSTAANSRRIFNYKQQPPSAAQTSDATKPEVASQEQPETSDRMTNGVTIFGLNMYAAHTQPLSGILTVWKSYDSSKSMEEDGDVTAQDSLGQQQQQQQQQQQPSTDSTTTQSSRAQKQQQRLTKLPSFEEVSPLTERDRVYRWLSSVDCIPLSSKPLPPNDGRASDLSFLSTAKLSQTVGLVSVGVADQLRGDAYFEEACDVYKYALGIFQDNPPSDGVSSSSPYCQMVARLLRDIGIVKCNMGEMAAGCQLLEESASLYEWSPPGGGDSNETISAKPSLTAEQLNKVAEVWYVLGNMFLDDELRGESLLDYVMHVVQRSLGGSNGKPRTEPDDDQENASADDKASTTASENTADDDEGDDSYSVCTQEAMSCYQRVIQLLDKNLCPRGSSGEVVRAQLYACTLAHLADCYLVTNQFHRAVDCYERSLGHFRLAAVGSEPDERRLLALLNAHVLGQMGTVNFLLRNYQRAAAMYEMSSMLRHHVMPDDADSAAGSTLWLEAAWTRSMHGLTLSVLGRHEQCIVWMLRAFAEFVRVLKGQIISVRPAVRRWFVIETLYTLAKSYATVETSVDSAIHYLTVAKNLIRAAPDEEMDVQQHFKVLMTLADVYDMCGNADEAFRFQTDAAKLASDVDVDLLSGSESDRMSRSPSRRMSGSSLNGTLDAEGRSGDVISEDAIRDDVSLLIDQLRPSDDQYDGGTIPTDIDDAERYLEETVSMTGGSAAAAVKCLGRVPADARNRGGHTSELHLKGDNRPQDSRQLVNGATIPVKVDQCFSSAPSPGAVGQREGSAVNTDRLTLPGDKPLTADKTITNTADSRLTNHSVCHKPSSDFAVTLTNGHHESSSTAERTRGSPLLTSTSSAANNTCSSTDRQPNIVECSFNNAMDAAQLQQPIAAQRPPQQTEVEDQWVTDEVVIETPSALRNQQHFMRR